MKIAFFTDSFLPNTDGVAVVTDEIAQYLAKKGHKITIVCPGNTTEIVKQSGYKVIRIKSYSIKLYEEHKVCFKTPEYLEQLDDFSKYDLIHLQTNVTLASIGFMVALKYNKPISCTFHTNIADFVTSFFDENVLMGKKNIMYDLIGKNKIILSILRKFSDSIMWKLTRDFHNAVPSTSVPSHYCKALLRKKGVKNDIFVIPNPVNPSHSGREYFKKFPVKDKFVLLHVGRLSVEKRVNLLIEAAAELKDKIPNLQIIICSEGPMRSYLERIAKRKHVEKIVKFTGWVSRDELNFLYEQSSIVTGFGLFETFNLCIAEALIYGKPVVVSDAGPLSEFVNNNGFVVPVNNEEVVKISESILKLYSNKSLYNKYSLNSRKLGKAYNYDDTMTVFENYLINSEKANKILFKHYVNYIRYVSSISAAINTLFFTLSLKFKQFDKIQEAMDDFIKSVSSSLPKFKKSF
ncbi:Glycosyltransferase Gtf1 [Candidatus Tiddalikarchaeum anstoanum]|nr:Glycosyltransferase Gtf1 [Candidatus Tiddalikarchaeum anstoanum]